MPMTDLQFPYGAVYFRKSNPPQEHWERDYAVAAQDGLNIFRHWFMWGAIETAPGVYDWEEYDRQLDLARRRRDTVARRLGIASQGAAADRRTQLVDGVHERPGFA